MKTFAAIWTISLVWAFGASAAECRDEVFEDTPFTVCTADPATEDIRLFLSDDAGEPLGTFDNLSDAVRANGQSLVFAMNAGMYHPDRSPVGLYVENGEQRAPIVTRDGPGNFALLPNGVLCLADGDAAIVESRAFARLGKTCEFATQSGPMLVIDGDLHPKFLRNSDSRFRRNGAGVGQDGTLFTVISDRPVNFHRFARFFRDVLKTPNALFFDGKVSRLYAPALDRHDFGFPMGPMIGVVE